MAKEKSKRTKQKRLPGMEIRTNKKIEDAADAFYAACKKYEKAAADKKEAGTILLDAMRKAKLSTYECEDKIVNVEEKEKITVKAKGHESNGDDNQLDPAADKLVRKTADDLAP